ncbi:MAG: helix-turn-helix transcriptional regulator, partial [Imperialibacter sp.]
RLAQPLSEREFEILTHALSNLNNSEIAEKVFVSVNTVKYHLKNIYEKLGVTNRKEALQFALSTPKE